MKGFSLLEALIAGTILAIILSAVASSISHVSDFIVTQRIKKQGQLIAQSHLESLLAIEYERPLTAGDCSPIIYSGNVKGDDGGVFVASCQLVPDHPEEGYTRLMVEVIAERNGKRMRSRFATYVVTQ